MSPSPAVPCATTSMPPGSTPTTGCAPNSTPSRWNCSTVGSVRVGRTPLAGQDPFDVGHDRGIVGYHHGRVPGDDLAVGRDEELLEVPPDVTVVALDIGGLGGPCVEAGGGRAPHPARLA